MRSTCTLHTTERSIRPSASMWMLSAVRRARLMYPAIYSFLVNDCLFLNLPTLETFRGTQDQGQFIRLNWVSLTSSCGTKWLPGDTWLLREAGTAWERQGFRTPGPHILCPLLWACTISIPPPKSANDREGSRCCCWLHSVPTLTVCSLFEFFAALSRTSLIKSVYHGMCLDLGTFPEAVALSGGSSQSPRTMQYAAES